MLGMLVCRGEGSRTSPHSVSCLSVVFSNGTLLPVCGELPIALVIWGFSCLVPQRSHTAPGIYGTHLALKYSIRSNLFLTLEAPFDNETCPAGALSTLLLGNFI